MRSLARYLTALGFDVRGAATAADGVADLGGVYAVVLDLELGRAAAPGTDVLRAIRAGGLPPRVAIWTSHVDGLRLAAAVALGPDAVFHKMQVSELAAWLGDPA
jgi:DNA-binding NarL/FixJ family response regulator